MSDRKKALAEAAIQFAESNDNESFHQAIDAIREAYYMPETKLEPKFVSREAVYFIATNTLCAWRDSYKTSDYRRPELPDLELMHPTGRVYESSDGHSFCIPLPEGKGDE